VGTFSDGIGRYGFFNGVTTPMIELIPDEIWRRYSSVVKLSFDLTPILSAVKTSLNPNVAKLSKWETVILRTLNYPLILGIENPLTIQ
jgi:hypothetical protein